VSLKPATVKARKLTPFEIQAKDLHGNDTSTLKLEVNDTVAVSPPEPNEKFSGNGR